MQLRDRLGKASAAIIVAGILASVAAGAFTINLVSKNSRLSEDVAAVRAAQLLRSSIEVAEAKLQAVSGYFSVERTVTPDDFASFIDRLGDAPVLKGLQFIRIVPDGRLQEYIMAQRQLRPDFNVYDKTSDVGRSPVQERDLHYVIELVSPLKGNEAAVGLDLATNPVVFEEFKTTTAAGRTIVTDSFKLVQNRDELALLMFTPTYKNWDASQSIVGFAAGLVSLDRVVEAISSEQAILLGIKNQATGSQLMPVLPVPEGYSQTLRTISLPGDNRWLVTMATLEQGSPQAAGMLVFGLGALLTLLALAGLQQSRLQATNLRVGAQLTASEQSRATSELSLAAREVAYRALFENASSANVEVDVQSGEILRVNEAMAELCGLDESDLIGKPVVDLVDSEDREILSSALTSKQASTVGLPGVELHLRRESGDNIWVLASIGETSEAVSGLPSACIVMQDISARKRADESRDLLVRELAHRVRNSMQLIGSLADQTSRTSRDVPSFLDNFKGRLLALNSAQDALFDANWGPVRVDMLAPKILEPFETGSSADTIHTDIEALTLLPQEAQTVALALYELANNASRHGSLKTPGGKVRLTIRLDEESSTPESRILKLTWVESGGAEPVSAPETTGFGFIMLERLLARQHGGESRFDWDTDGMKFESRLPLANAENVVTDKKY